MIGIRENSRLWLLWQGVRAATRQAAGLGPRCGLRCHLHSRGHCAQQRVARAKPRLLSKQGIPLEFHPRPGCSCMEL